MTVRNRILFVLLTCSVSAGWPVIGGVPSFDENQAYAYLVQQCGFGPRIPGSPGHEACLNFFREELLSRTPDVRLEKFHAVIPQTGTTAAMTNVIARFGPGGPAVLLCAHWDTRPYADWDPDPSRRREPVPGANDGASGCAVLLELARLFQKNPPPVGVELVLFDGEDAGLQGRDATWCLGSRHYAGSLSMGEKPVFAILLDMIGDRDLQIPQERNSLRYAPDLVRRLWELAGRLGLYAFVPEQGADIIDDHLELMRVGIPAVDLIDFDYPYWHTTQDTQDKCSPASLGVVGTLLLHFIYENPLLD